MIKKDIIKLTIGGIIAFLILSTMFYNDTKKLSGGYAYYPDLHAILGKIDIPPSVISYTYNKEFILAKQKPERFHQAIYDKMEYKYPHGRDSIYYWLIVLKDEDIVLGPLDISEFNKAKDKYKVPSGLKLE